MANDNNPDRDGTLDDEVGGEDEGCITVTPGASNGKRAKNESDNWNYFQLDTIESTVRMTLFDKVKCCKRTDLLIGSVGIGIVLGQLNLKLSDLDEEQKKELQFRVMSRMNSLKNDNRRAITNNLSKYG
jgi:hypothetical protein